MKLVSDEVSIWRNRVVLRGVSAFLSAKAKTFLLIFDVLLMAKFVDAYVISALQVCPKLQVEDGN